MVTECAGCATVKYIRQKEWVELTIEPTLLRNHI